ncbi:hypothetical protein BVG90_01280 [Serratia marcescens]|nr:hypothetical protein BVG90_01280 [Serratia marcescens]
MIATKPLSVTAVKNQACDADSKLAVALIFSSPGGGLVESNTALDLGNGTYFSIKDQERKIAFETPVKFWDNVQSGSQQTVTYQTELRAREVLKMGVAAKSIVLYANYRYVLRLADIFIISMALLIYPSYFKLHVRWLRLLTPVTDLSKLKGILRLVAFLQLELFWV